MKRFSIGLALSSTLLLTVAGGISAALGDSITSTTYTTGPNSGSESYWSQTSPNGRYHVVENYGDGSLAITDLQTSTITILPGGTLGSNTALYYAAQPVFSPDSSTIYAGDYQSNPGNVIKVIDAATATVTSHISLPSPFYASSLEIWSMAISGNGSKLLVDDYHNSKIALIDISNPASPSVIGSVHNGDESFEALVTAPDGLQAYGVVNGDLHTFDLTTGAETITAGIIPTTSTIYALAVSPDGASLIVSVYGDSAIYKIDLGTNTLAATSTDSHLSYPWGVATSIDGVKLYVANYDGSALVFNVSDLSYDTSYSVAPGTPLDALSFSPDGSKAFFTDDIGVTHLMTVTQGVTSGSNSAPPAETPEATVALASTGSRWAEPLSIAAALLLLAGAGVLLARRRTSDIER